MNRLLRPALMTLFGSLLLGGAVQSAENPFAFSDVGQERGLLPDVSRIAGHGVGWGDVDNDGWPDLYVGSFGAAPYDSKPNQFFRNIKGHFKLDDQVQLRGVGRANGAIFVDFDQDGDLDLYATNHAIDGGTDPVNAHYSAPNMLFRNDGGGKFTDVSAGSGVCDRGLATRSACAVDFDGDSLPDLLVGECFFQGGMSRSRLYRNRGGLKFDQCTVAAGLPEQLTGFGVTAGDVNGDTWPDLMFGGRHHGNRLFVNDGHGKFLEVPQTHAAFIFEFKDTPDDTPCGVCMGDLNNDGRLDIVIGSHFDRPWFTGGVPVRLYLNRGNDGLLPKFEDVTTAVGLIPLPMKSPHVEVQDFDNDGRMDIYTSIVKFAGDKPHPVIFQNQGVKDGLPQFKEFALGVNDFPTELDRKTDAVGVLFDRMEKEHKIVYTAPGPSCDFDRDGRLDLFLANWWVNSPSLLLRNESPEQEWLQIAIEGGEGVNRQGIGARVSIYEAGKLGDPAALIADRDMAIGYGYASGQEALAHFGLGKRTSCDVEINLPHGKGKRTYPGVTSKQLIKLK